MNIEIVGKDKNGIRRVYGLHENLQHLAINACIEAGEDYLQTRPDIDALYLYNGDTDQPIISSATNRVFEIR